MPFENVILDFDGTIADSRQDIARAQLWAMAQVGAPGRREEELYPLIGLPLEETFRRLLPSALHGRIGDAAAHYAEYYPSRSLLTTRLFPGVRETLERLRARGKKLAVASTKRGSGIRRATDHFGITHLFDRLQGSEGLPFKPDPAVIRAVLEGEAWDPAATLMVGDTAMDVLAGKNAGSATCGVTYGAAADEVRAARPDFIIDDFPALESVVL
ncbi:MAG TPA: HAD-IA family hydrolase [Bacteroidota bacterium]|nr:HAD-IA family hydrolase [Bacteroidota bacterium]